MPIQKGGRAVQSHTSFVEDGRVGLKHMRNAGGDLKRDRNVGVGSTSSKTDGVAQQDLVRTHLDKQRRQSSEITENGTDERVSGIRPRNVVRGTQPETVG